jgi:hypothetical protein
MQLTIQQLKTSVLEHVSADWVRENFGKLTLKSTWQKAYDRTRELASVAKDKTIEIIETGKPCAQFAYNTIASVVYWFIVAGFFTYFAGQALRQWWDSEPAHTASDWESRRVHPLLSSTVKIAA